MIVVFAMIAFACNSLLCRAALKDGSIDPATFTSVRLISGALVLWLIVKATRGLPAGKGSWLSALALFIYAAGFSFAYVSLPASTGALLLFSAVQVSMIGWGWWTGERLKPLQISGFALAIAGLVGLLLPGVSAPSTTGSLLMISAGIAWGVYSLHGKKGGNPIRVTADNFLYAVPLTVVCSLLLHDHASFTYMGLIYAVLSGALASGIGYAIWYTALPHLKATNAAVVQLSVPVIAAYGGVVMLDEHVTLRLALASVAILGGIALVILNARRA